MLQLKDFLTYIDNTFQEWHLSPVPGGLVSERYGALLKRPWENHKRTQQTVCEGEVECRQVFLIKKIKINLEDCMRRIGLRQMQAGQKAASSAWMPMASSGGVSATWGSSPVRMWKLWPRPLRDPVALRLFGVTLALRNREADYITVEVA